MPPGSPRRPIPIRLSAEALAEVDALALGYDTNRTEVLRRLLTIGLRAVRSGRSLFPDRPTPPTGDPS